MERNGVMEVVKISHSVKAYGYVHSYHPGYADVLLIFAEAENEGQCGPTAAAYDAVNQLRVRAGLDNLSGLSKETFRQAIQKEWTLETTHERIYRFNFGSLGALI